MAGTAPASRRPQPAWTIASSVALAAIAIALLFGCAGTHVTLRYQPDPTLERVTAAHALTIYNFSDARGSEGDHDIFRVGGIYLVPKRLLKVMTDTPWPRALSQALAAGFMARGVPVTIAYQPFTTRVTSFATPYALTGEIENFSTEFRFGVNAHVSGIVRLQDRDGAILVEKRISERRMWGIGPGAVASDDPLQDMLNRALAGFVSKVVNDPEVIGVLTRQ